MNRIHSLVIALLLASPAAHTFAAATPVVFWAPDQIAPGDVALLYGGGLAQAEKVLVQSLEAGGTEISAPVIQPAENSLKFMLPASVKAGVFSVQVAAGGKRSPARLINQLQQ